jgi:hypothetical protein
MRDLDSGMAETMSRIDGLAQAAGHVRVTSGAISEIVSGFRLE